MLRRYCARQNIYAGPHNVHQWLNPSAFVNPPVATRIGQADYSPLGGSPNQARGPGFQNLDMSLFKQFAIHESVKAEFRAEAFNLANWHEFSNPGPAAFSFTSLGDLNFQNPSGFSQITSSRNNARVLQLALKLYY
jgi:hypothetical protein